MARISRPRKPRPPGAPGRTKPPPSEEDFYLQAGAPGYTEDRSIEAQQAAASATGQPKSQQAGKTERQQPETEDGRLVRNAVVKVPRDRLDELTAVFTTEVVPMYQECWGFVSARLLIGHETPDGNEDGVEAGDAAVDVISQTTWSGPAALELATKRPAYARAMRRLADVLPAAPTTQQFVCAVHAAPVAPRG